MTAYEIAMAAQKAAQPQTAPAPTAPVAPVIAPVTVVAPATPPVVPAQPAPILERAILVTLNISIPGNGKVDRKVSDKVKADQHLGKDSGKWEKTVFPPALYSYVSKLAGMIRTWHYAHSLPYPVGGLAILPSGEFFAYTKQMGEFRQRFEEAAEAFVSRLPEIMAWARQEHNGSYDETLYNADDIRAKFGFSIGFTPIPSGNHFVGKMREALGPDVAMVDTMVAEALKDAEKELWNRIAEPLRNVSAILAKKDQGQKTRITESLIENVREIAELIPSMNLNDCPKLNEFAELAKAAFEGLTSEDVSEDATKRTQARKAADDLLKRLAGIR